MNQNEPQMNQNEPQMNQNEPQMYQNEPLESEKCQENTLQDVFFHVRPSECIKINFLEMAHTNFSRRIRI